MATQGGRSSRPSAEEILEAIAVEVINGRSERALRFRPREHGRATFYKSIKSVTSNPIRYIGGYYDVTSGLYKLGARFYDATLGRFTQVDPSGQSQNQYAYAGDDPIDGEDPAGLRTTGLSTGLSIASTVVGAAGLFATASGIGIEAAPFLGLASTALNIGSEIAAGDSGGAIAASAITGAFSFGIGGGIGANLAGDLSSGSRLAQTVVGGLGSGTETLTGAFAR